MQTINEYGEIIDIIKLSAEANKVFESFQSEIWAKMIPEVNRSYKILGKYMPLTGSDCYNSYIEFEDGSEEITVDILLIDLSKTVNCIVSVLLCKCAEKKRI